MARNYRVMNRLDGVDFWSDERLPFAPSGWRAAARGELRAALGDVPPVGRGEVLEAVYASDNPAACDLENVLCYNIGTGTFTHLATHGVVLRRSFQTPERHRHWYAYRLETRRDGRPTDAERRNLARWSFTPGALHAEPTVAQVWYWCRRAAIEPEGAEVPERFGVRIHVAPLAAARVRPAGLLKGFVDGILCALHDHDGSDLPELAGRIATQLRADEAEIRDLLAPRPAAPLGTRRLVARHGAGIRWNPADDHCLTIELLVDDPSTDEPACWGTLFQAGGGSG